MKIKEHLIEKAEEYNPWIMDYNQGRVELKILPYLQDIENGFFIEAGALNGLFQSNTKILEDLGWSGLLVEPSLKAYEECLKNRKCHIENCALVSFNNKEEFVYGDFHYDGNQGIGARSRVLDSGVKVTAKTLTSILNNLEIKTVDFMSLDVEGYEIEVLNGIDFNSIFFKYMLVEVNSDFYSLEFLNNFLLEKGFENIKNISNFTPITTPSWPSNHQDYLYKNIAI